MRFSSGVACQLRSAGSEITAEILCDERDGKYRECETFQYITERLSSRNKNDKREN